MIVKSFLLRQDKIQSIAALCDKETIAVVRPEKKVEALFRDAIRKTIVEKKTAKEEFDAIKDYFEAVAAGPAYKEKVASTLSAVEYYLREGMYVQTSPHAIEDYVMAKCARLCAEAVNQKVGGNPIDGTSLMLCLTEQHFDWAASKEQMVSRLKGE